MDENLNDNFMGLPYQFRDENGAIRCVVHPEALREMIEEGIIPGPIERYECHRMTVEEWTDATSDDET